MRLTLDASSLAAPRLAKSRLAKSRPARRLARRDAQLRGWGIILAASASLALWAALFHAAARVLG